MAKKQRRIWKIIVFIFSTSIFVMLGMMFAWTLLGPFSTTQSVAIGVLELRIDASGFPGLAGWAGAVVDSGVGQGLVFAVNGSSCRHRIYPLGLFIPLGAILVKFGLVVGAGFDGVMRLVSCLGFAGI